MSRAASAALAALLALASARALADDYVTVRGAYYREASTRVIQPTVEVERDDASGWDVKAHYLLDAITSASIAAGTATDTIFTETRNEVGLAVRKRWDRADITASYKYSTESDYWSHGFGLSLGGRFWGDTARVTASMGVDLDKLSSRARTPECATPPSVSCTLNGYYGGLAYTQVLSPVAIAQVSAEAAYLDGFQGNLYRSVPNFGYERLPDTRLRTAYAARFAYYFPRRSIALRLHYRYYNDFGPHDPTGSNPWDIQSHMIEARLYTPLSQTVELRLTLREYFQSRANFWCDAVAAPGCYISSARYYSTDPKLGPVITSYPEAQLVWQPTVLASVPVLSWLVGGSFAISYGHFFQSTSFGQAHVLQAGYTLPY